MQLKAPEKTKKWTLNKYFFPKSQMGFNTTNRFCWIEFNHSKYHNTSIDQMNQNEEDEKPQRKQQWHISSAAYEKQSHTSNHHTGQITQATHSHGKRPGHMQAMLECTNEGRGHTHNHTPHTFTHRTCAASEGSNPGDLQLCPTAKQKTKCSRTKNLCLFLSFHEWHQHVSSPDGTLRCTEARTHMRTDKRQRCDGMMGRKWRGMMGKSQGEAWKHADTTLSFILLGGIC